MADGNTAEYLTAAGTWGLVLVTGAAVFVGWRAAQAANATFRLEAEPKLVVRPAGGAKVFARWGVLHRLPANWSGNNPEAEATEPFGDAPLYLVDGKADAENRRIIKNGFALRSVEWAELNQGPQPPVWPALRVEIRNVGRSPVIQAGLHWNISAPIFVTTFAESDGYGPEVETRTDQATTVIDGVGPNDSTFIWFANTTGTAFTLTLRSPGYQRDPLNFESLKTTPLSMLATNTFSLPGMIGEAAPPPP